MKRLFLASVCSLTLFATAAVVHAEMAPGSHMSGGLGFHNSNAPVGVRWWMAGQKVGIDLGVGFGSSPAAVDPDEKENNFSIDAGVPFVMHSWEGVHVLFRPGVFYSSQQVGFDSDPLTAGVQFDTENATTLGVGAEIEAEVFLRDNFSVSAAHGIRFDSFNPAGPGDSITSFGTTGNNFTTVGFHVYFLGGSQ